MPTAARVTAPSDAEGGERVVDEGRDRRLGQNPDGRLVTVVQTWAPELLGGQAAERLQDTWAPGALQSRPVDPAAVAVTKANSAATKTPQATISRVRRPAGSRRSAMSHPSEELVVLT